MQNKDRHPSYLRLGDGAVYLSIKLQPRAGKNQIIGIVGNELKIKVTAPPVDSAANEALIRFLADQLGCGKSAVQLVRGQTSRNKLVTIRGVELAKIIEVLGGQNCA